MGWLEYIERNEFVDFAGLDVRGLGEVEIPQLTLATIRNK
jgi:hypothetical protein